MSSLGLRPRDDMSTSGQHIWMFHLQPCIICILLAIYQSLCVFTSPMMAWSLVAQRCKIVSSWIHWTKLASERRELEFGEQHPLFQESRRWTKKDWDQWMIFPDWESVLWVPFSGLTLLVGWQEGCSACERPVTLIAKGSVPKEVDEGLGRTG